MNTRQTYAFAFYSTLSASGEYIKPNDAEVQAKTNDSGCITLIKCQKTVIFCKKKEKCELWMWPLCSVAHSSTLNKLS